MVEVVTFEQGDIPFTKILLKPGQCSPETGKPERTLLIESRQHGTTYAMSALLSSEHHDISYLGRRLPERKDPLCSRPIVFCQVAQDGNPPFRSGLPEDMERRLRRTCRPVLFVTDQGRRR